MYSIQIPLRIAAFLLLVGLGLPGSPGRAQESAAPFWAWWTDLSRLADLDPQTTSGLRSSFCPEGCRYDRHSSTTPRYLARQGDEGVLFDVPGAGVITRIWMTSGEGTSRPLDPDATLRIYLDQASQPVFEGPLPTLFDGSQPPFTLPLAGDRDVSSGGNFSYVPIPFRNGCRITLEGGDTANLWFQFNYQSLVSATGVHTFTGKEDLADLRRLLRSRPGTLDKTSERVKQKFTLAPAGDVESRLAILSLDGPGELTGFRLHLPRDAWARTRLIATFDGQQTVNLTVAEFFAQGLAGLAKTQSLLIGVDDRQVLYSKFPMPFRQSARIELTNADGKRLRGRLVARWTRGTTVGAGLFGAQLQISKGASSGTPHPLLDLEGRGKWVGLVADLRAKRTREYLEGDERVYIDGDPEPTLHGTGTEDIFNAGFYFDQGPFGMPLHGAPLDRSARRAPRTVAYRLMLTDAIHFERSIRAELEAGPTGNIAMAARTIAYYYRSSVEDAAPEGEDHQY